MYENLKKHEEEIIRCIRCGFCKAVCPVYKELGWESSTPRGKMMICLALQEKKISLTDLAWKSIYCCTTCGNCKEICLSGVNTVEIIESMRADFCRIGKSLEKHRKIKESILKYGNPLFERGCRISFLKKIKKKAELVYFIGCIASYRMQEIAKSTVNVLKNTRVDFTILENEKCCGSVLLRTGAVDEAKYFAKHNVKEIEKTGAKKVVFSCAGCYRTFKKDYPKIVDIGFEVTHISEYLNELMKQGKIEPKNTREIVTYHDPCHLGRHCGIYEQPRRVIRKIATLIEMEKNRENSRCCGAGGGVKSGFPEIARDLGKRRIRDAEDIGVDTIVTSCPFCVYNLKESAKYSNVSVKDFSEFIAERIHSLLARGLNC
ncbi:MAG: (Fe-S)-binding protein [Methanosarcinales archaeon]